MPAHNLSSKGKARNSSSGFWQLWQTAGKHVALWEAGYFQQKLAPKYIFLQTDLFLEDNLKSNLLFRKTCSMFPFKCCSFTIWLACAVQQNSLPQSSEKLENKKKDVSIPTSCFCLLQVPHPFACVICDTFLVDWLTPRSYYSMWYFWTLFIVVGLLWVFPPQLADIWTSCVQFLTVFSPLTPTLSFRPESPLLCVYFYTISPSALFSPFPWSFAYYTFMNFFNVFWIGCVFFCFSLI